MKISKQNKIYLLHLILTSGWESCYAVPFFSACNFTQRQEGRLVKQCQRFLSRGNRPLTVILYIGAHFISDYVGRLRCPPSKDTSHPYSYRWQWRWFVEVWLIINYPAPVTCRGPGYPDGYHSRDKTDGLFAHNVFLLSRRIVIIVFLTEG